MTDGVRGGLGILCFALIALVISLGTQGGSAEMASDIARVLAIVFGVFGLGLLAYSLLKTSD